MSRITHRQWILLSAYLVTAITFVGLCGELLVPGHHVHVGDSAGHHHHFFTGPHHHQGDGASQDALRASDGVAGTGSCGVEEPAQSGHLVHGSAHSHEQGHGHSHPEAHATDDRRGTSDDDTPADSHGPSMGHEPQTSADCGAEAPVQVVSEHRKAIASEPSRVPDPAEPPGPKPDSTPDSALIDSGVVLDDPTPRGETWAPLPRPTVFPGTSRLEFPDDPTRRPDSARAPPSLSLV